VLAAELLPLLLVRSVEWLWVVYAVAFWQSTVSQLVGPAEHALLPRLVGRGNLVSANALNALNNNLARLIGPPIGGTLAAAFSLTGVALADAATFLVAGAMITLIRTPSRVERSAVPGSEAGDEAARSWGRFWSEWLQGLNLVGRSPILRVLFIGIALVSLGEGVFAVMFLVWVQEVLGGGVQELGWFMGAQAVGGLLGGLVIGRFGSGVSPARLLGVSGLVFGILDLSLFYYPLLYEGLWLGLALIAVVGIPAAGLGAGLTTVLQTTVTDRYRGRVFGAIGTTSALLALAGTLTAGTLDERVNPLVLLTVQGAVYILTGVLALTKLGKTATSRGALHAASGARP
jgi:MFS family permease